MQNDIIEKFSLLKKNLITPISKMKTKSTTDQDDELDREIET